MLERGPCTGGIAKEAWVLGTLGTTRWAIGMGPRGSVWKASLTALYQIRAPFRPEILGSGHPTTNTTKDPKTSRLWWRDERICCSTSINGWKIKEF